MTVIRLHQGNSSASRAPVFASDQESMKPCASATRDCPVCLQAAVFPVQTNCGHLFCGTTWNLTLFIRVEQCLSRHVFMKFPPNMLMWFSVPWAKPQGLRFRVEMRLKFGIPWIYLDSVKNSSLTVLRKCRAGGRICYCEMPKKLIQPCDISLKAHINEFKC